MSAYIKERYIVEANNSEIAFAYLTYLNKEGFQVIEDEVGFIVYKFQGDACIVNDIYTRTEHRKTKGAWKLFNKLRAITTANSNCNVLIGFSEFYGQGHEDGKGAMKAAGFVKTGEDTMKEIYIRGNY